MARALESSYIDHEVFFRDAAPRVLAVIPGDGSGNSFIFARRQVESLTRAGIQIKTFYLGRISSGFRFIECWTRLRAAIRDFSPDVIHAHYGTITALLCACSTLRPLAITFRGSDLNSDPRVGVIRARLSFILSQLSALRASAIICTSSRLRDRLWWRKGKTITVPSGVDLELFVPFDRLLSRRVLGWHDDEQVVVFNSGGNPFLKGLDLARAAIKIAEKAVGSIRFVELDGSVSPQSVPTYLNAADCLLVASEFEGSPNIVKEALACNLPVVGVDVGDLAERLDGVFPSRIVPRDAESLGYAMAEIIGFGDRSNGRVKVADCCQDKTAVVIRNVYASLLETNRNCKSV